MPRKDSSQRKEDRSEKTNNWEEGGRAERVCALRGNCGVRTLLYRRRRVATGMWHHTIWAGSVLKSGRQPFEHTPGPASHGTGREGVKLSSSLDVFLTIWGCVMSGLRSRIGGCAPVHLSTIVAAFGWRLKAQAPRDSRFTGVSRSPAKAKLLWAPCVLGAFCRFDGSLGQVNLLTKWWTALGGRVRARAMASGKSFYREALQSSSPPLHPAHLG